MAVVNNVYHVYSLTSVTNVAHGVFISYFSNIFRRMHESRSIDWLYAVNLLECHCRP